MVACDSRAVLHEYLSAGVPPLGTTYRLTIGDLYHLEFVRSSPWRRGMPPEAVASALVRPGSADEVGAAAGGGGPQSAGGAAAVEGLGGSASGSGVGSPTAGLRWQLQTGGDPLGLAEAECAEQLQLWAVAALCRCVCNEHGGVGALEAVPRCHCFLTTFLAPPCTALQLASSPPTYPPTPPHPTPRSLSLDNIITLINAALLEKQLVIFCPHIGTLCASVLALVPLLRPFVWQSLLLPVTPTSMRGFLEAPVPFVLGVQYKTPEVLAR